MFYGAFQGGVSFVDPFLFMFYVCNAVLSVHYNIMVICWEMANLLALLYVIFSCVLSLSHVVSWVRCGI